VGSTQRSYLLYAPTVSHRPLPLVVVLHGLGASPTDESNRTGFGALAARDQAIVAFPAGVNGDWNVGNGCCAHHGQTPAAVDDGAFVSAVVTAIEGTERIDRTRVYLVGYSAGGKLAWRFACAGGGPFAAVATYGAVPVTACSSTGAGISVLVADGTADTELPYGGSSTQQPPTQAVSTVVDEWRTRDACPPASATSSPGPAVTVQTWDGCAGNMSVSFVRYPGLDHRWPDVAIRPAYADGATIFWAWLSRQHRS
jgi:polyhydroxybutyrate depolymerase